MIKKRHPRFNVPNYGAKKRKRVLARWRKQRGVDNKKRIYKSGYGAVPNIGYKNSENARFRKNGIELEKVVHNERELLQMEGSEVVAKFAHDISLRKRTALQEIADKKGIKISNRVR